MRLDFRPLAMVTQVGITMVVCILAGLAAGIWLDSILNTKPLATLVFILLGVGAGAYSVYRLVSDTLNDPTSPSPGPKKKRGYDDEEDEAKKDGEE